MTLTPVLGLINERFLLPRVGTVESIKRPIDHIAKTSKVILIGFGHFGSTVGRFLRAHGVEPTILDYDSNRVDLLRKMGFEVYYGDATRMDLLESAGIAEANMVITAVGSPDTTMTLVKMIRKKYPHIQFMVRAKNRYDAYELINAGIQNVYRSSLDTSVKLASDVLSKMGFREYTLRWQARNFIKMDEESLRELAAKSEVDEDYIFEARRMIREQERLLEEDLKRGILVFDNHWDSEQMRAAHDDGSAK